MGKNVEKLVGDRVLVRPPAVSVIVPAYNVAEFIKEALDSTVSQHFQDFEVIVVNDGSPDTPALEEVIKPYLSFIVYLKQMHGGLAAARNTGIAHARGTYIAFLDGDDIWFPDFLESQIHFLTATGYDFVYADARLFGENVREENYTANAPSHGEVSVKSLIAGTCNVLVSGTVVRRQCVVDVGGFEEGLPHIVQPEDFDLWIRLLKSGVSAGYQSKALLKYRVRPSSLSGSNVVRVERMISALNTIKNKYELTEEELRTLDERLRWGQKNLALERAKTSLVAEDYSAAKRFLDAAWDQESSLKQQGIKVLLSLFPKTSRFLFNLLRSEEYEFIRKGNEPTK